MTTPERDDELLTRLSAADPAQHLRPMTPLERRQAILAASRPATPARRWRSAWGLAGGAVTTGLVALLVVNALTPDMSSTTLDYGAAGGPASSCGTVTAQTLTQREAAFQAVVTAADDNSATLRVEQVFIGQISDEVTVPQSQGQSSEIDLGLLEIGQTYLIAMDGTTIATCGQSGRATDELIDLYRQAYP